MLNDKTIFDKTMNDLFTLEQRLLSYNLGKGMSFVHLNFLSRLFIQKAYYHTAYLFGINLEIFMSFVEV